jgi:hypothetical protein
MTMALRDPIDFAKYRPAVQEALKEELAAIDAGNIESAALIQGIVHNWSFERYQQVAAFKGKGWRALSPLADKSLQIEGWGMLALINQIVGSDLVERTVIYARGSLKRINALEAADGTEDEFLAQLYSDGKQDITENAREAREWYRNQVRKMFE